MESNIKTGQERRYRPHADLRVKGDGTSPGIMTGNAVVYNCLSENLGCFYEIIAPGTFTESLKTADVRCLIDHISHLLLGRNISKTLTLTDGPEALAILCNLPDVSYARDLAVNIELENLDGMSFGFIATEDSFNEDAEGRLIRTVTKAELFDVSAVTYPAYTQTVVGLRSLEAWKKTQPQGLRNENHLLKLQLREKSYRPR